MPGPLRTTEDNDSVFLRNAGKLYPATRRHITDDPYFVKLPDYGVLCPGILKTLPSV
jgi:hypothetical protein